MIAFIFLNNMIVYYLSSTVYVRDARKLYEYLAVYKGTVLNYGSPVAVLEVGFIAVITANLTTPLLNPCNIQSPAIAPLTAVFPDRIMRKKLRGTRADLNTDII